MSKAKRMSVTNAMGIWLLVLTMGGIVTYLAMADPMSLLYTLIGIAVLFGVPWLFTRLWNARLDRLERKHYHAD